MTSTLPLPGKPVRGSATGRPVMALLDLLDKLKPLHQWAEDWAARDA
jgi:hypothetical protein